MAVASPPPRRRRSPEESEREILAAAEEFLRDRPLRELTIDEVMDRTGLSRPSFYVYFRDRHDLVARLAREISGELFAMAERWLKGTGDPLDDARAALDGVVVVYAQHGVVMRALADAASEDEEMEALYRSLIDGFIQATAKHIREEMRAGRAEADDPDRTAAALVWMNERYLTETLAREPVDDPAKVAEALLGIWTRTIYGRPPR